MDKSWLKIFFSVPIFKDQDSLEICDKKLGPLCVEKPVFFQIPYLLLSIQLYGPEQNAMIRV